jgi:uncharacterized protein YciI
MKQLFLVTEVHGRTWDPGKPMNGQAQWPEHAAFMNRLAADGFVVLGGPLGESDDVLLIVDARSADDIRATLALDPWIQSQLIDIKSIQGWKILLDHGEPENSDRARSG